VPPSAQASEVILPLRFFNLHFAIFNLQWSLATLATAGELQIEKCKMQIAN
jgi:hypothetical protein